MKKGTVKIRGIRSPVQTGHLIGRSDAGGGDPHPIKPGRALALSRGSLDVAISGDVTIDQKGDATVVGLQGVPIAATAPTNLYVLTFDAGTGMWKPAAAASGGGTVTTTGSPASGNLAKFSGASSITNGDLSGDVSTSGSLVTTIGAGKVTEAMQVLANNTTNNVSTTKHGYVPILPNDATKYLDGTGAFSVPAGGGGGGSGLYSQVLSATPTKSSTGLTSVLGSGTTVTDQTVGVNFDATGANAGMITSSVPATPYSITTLLIVNNSSQYSIPAIGWSDGTKLHFVYAEYPTTNTHVNILGFSNISTFASTIQQNTSRFVGGRLFWWKIRDDGTTVYFYSSGDGLNWGLEYSVAKAAGYLGASGYTKLFVGCPGGSGAVNITVGSWTQGV